MKHASPHNLCYKMDPSKGLGAYWHQIECRDCLKKNSSKQAKDQLKRLESKDAEDPEGELWD